MLLHVGNKIEYWAEISSCCMVTQRRPLMNGSKQEIKSVTNGDLQTF